VVIDGSHFMESAMNKKIMLAVAMVPCLAVGNAHATQCFANQKVTKIWTGYTLVGPMGPDYGDAVYFELGNGSKYPLNNSFNLDSARGMALHRMLLAAFVGQRKITGTDHYGGTCDDVDEIGFER
jgi:hypothetical protein